MGCSSDSGADRSIFAYSRAQAIADAVLIDVSDVAREAGFKVPVAVTSEVWHRYVRAPEGVDGQDERGRLWDVLFMLHFAIARSQEASSEMLYSLLVRNNNDAPKPVKLKAVCGPGDDPRPVMTIMLPEED